MPTLQRNSEQTTTPERQKTNTWSDAENLVASFQFEPDFIGQLMQANVSPGDTTSREYADALSAYSESFLAAHEADQTVSPDLAQQITLIANAPLFVHTQKELIHFENKRSRGYLPDNEWNYFQSLKPYIIWFNQQVSDYAYEHPSDRLSDVNKALMNSALSGHPRDAELVEQHIENTTRGARTEAVTRQLLDVANVPYTPGSLEEDSRGGDIIVDFKGHRIKVDIKSSLSDIAHVRGGYDKIEANHITYAINKRPGEKVSDHVVKLYPGFEDGDIGDTLGIQPDSEFAQTRSQFIAIQLMKAAMELGF